MEAIVMREQISTMSRQDFGLRLQITIDHIQSIERLLDEKVGKEMESLIHKHAHIQNEINE